MGYNFAILTQSRPQTPLRMLRHGFPPLVLVPNAADICSPRRWDVSLTDHRRTTKCAGVLQKGKEKVHLSITTSTSISCPALNRKQLTLIQNLRNLLQIPNRTLPMAHQEQFLRIRRQAQVSGRFALRQAVDPFHEIFHLVALGHRHASVSVGVHVCFFRAWGGFDELVVELEGFGG